MVFGRASVLTAGAALLLLATAAPVSAASPSVVVAHTDTQYSVIPAGVTIAGPKLNAGTWWVRVTAELDGSKSAVVTGETECDLTDGKTQLDQAAWLLDLGHPTGRADVSMLLTAVKTSSKQWTPSLHCATKASTSMVLTFVRIDAVSGGLSGSITPRFAAASGGPVPVPGDGAFHNVGSLALPAGRWSILAKTKIADTSLSVGTDVTCRLSPSTADTDKTTQSLNNKPSVGSEGEIGVEVAHTFSSAATVGLQCKGSTAASFTADQVRLVAVKAAKLSLVSLGGSTTTTGTGTPFVVSGFHNGSVAIPTGAIGGVASLALTAGKWYVSAKAWVTGDDMKIECQLTNQEGGGQLGTVEFRGDGFTGVYLQNGVDVTTPVHAQMRCDADQTGGSLTFIRITAIKATSVTVLALP